MLARLIDMTSANLRVIVVAPGRSERIDEAKVLQHFSTHHAPSRQRQFVPVTSTQEVLSGRPRVSARSRADVDGNVA